jgi:hypothetical protein
MNIIVAEEDGSNPRTLGQVLGEYDEAITRLQVRVSELELHISKHIGKHS